MTIRILFPRAFGGNHQVEIDAVGDGVELSLIHISEPTRPY